jgi:hypothetical protein
MNRGWSVLDVGLDDRARPSLTGPFPVVLPPGNQFGADHGHLTRGLDPEPDLPPFEADDSDADVVSDIELLHQLPRQDQHGTLPSSTSGISFLT